MKGVIFLLLKNFIEGLLGKEKFDEIRKEAGLTSAILATDGYPDEVFEKMLDITAQRAHQSRSEIERQFGKFAIHELKKSYVVFFRPDFTAKDFIKDMNRVHQQATKNIPGSTPPIFEYEEPDENTLVINYKSQRKLCDFLKGLIEGAAEIYNEKATITETQCMKRGAPCCTLVVKFSKP